MKLTLTFESIEEFDMFRAAAAIQHAYDDLARRKAAGEKMWPEDPAPEDPAPAPAAPEPDPDPVQEAPAPAPAYALADVQKAVRDVVRQQGKAAAKEILCKYPHKDRPGEQASSASSLRPEDYAAAVAALKETLNG